LALRAAIASHPRIHFVTSARVTGLVANKVDVCVGGRPGAAECVAGRIVGADGRGSFVRRRIGGPTSSRVDSRTAGVLLVDVELPFEGYGHIFLGGLSLMLLYRISERMVRVSIDVPRAEFDMARDAASLWDAYGHVLPSPLRAALYQALCARPVQWASNHFCPRTNFGDNVRALVGDAAGHFHPLTAAGMTLGFLDGQHLATCATLGAYQRTRARESRVPQALAVTLYEVFSGHDREMAAMRQAMYRVWRSSAAERGRTMGLLSGDDTSRQSFAAAFVHVAAVASGRVLGNAPHDGGWRQALTVLAQMAQRLPRLYRQVTLPSGADPIRSSPQPPAGNPAVPSQTAALQRPPLGTERRAGGATEHAAAALAKARGALLAEQRDDGAWEGEVVWCSLLGAQYALVHTLLGRELSAERRDSLLRDFRNNQLASGGWGLHPCSEAYLFTTALVYVAARFMGVDASDLMLARARRWIAAQGGVIAIPSWGKFWLALFNLYSWEGMHSIPPEAWALPSWLPISPGNFYCHTRLIYAAMAATYASRYQLPPSPLVEEIRREIYPMGYEATAFAQAASNLRTAEVVSPPSPALRLLNRATAALERRPPAFLRRRMVQTLLNELRFDLEQTAFGGLSPVSGLLSIIALWVYDRRAPEVSRALEAFDRWIWADDAGLRVAGAGSIIWDTAFAIQALRASPVAGEGAAAISRAAAFLSTQQLQDGDPALEQHHRQQTRGGFCFSARWHNWPVSDCTAEAMIALLGLQVDSSSLTRSDHADAVRFLLQRQNPDGGFGSYERRKTRWSLEWMNPAEMFGNSMTEGSYIECTASCIKALARFRRNFPGVLEPESRTAIARAASFLLRRQEADGKWQGAWGVHCLYGTMFAITGLAAAFDGAAHPAIWKACRWLCHQQRPDGGWGEHHDGCIQRRFVPRASSHVTQTAWALIALLEGNWHEWDGMARAARYLVSTQQEDGRWPQQEPVGVFFQSALLDYTLFKQVFPVWALGLYEQRRARRVALSQGHTPPRAASGNPAPRSRS
jgi:lanosterol synthase